MLTVAIPKRNKLQNIIVLTPKDGADAKPFFIRLILLIYQRNLFIIPVFRS